MQQCEDFPCRAVRVCLEHTESPACASTPLKSPFCRFVLQHMAFYHPVWVVLSSHEGNSCIVGSQAPLNLCYNLSISQKYYWSCQNQHPVPWTPATPLPGLQPEGLAIPAVPSAQLRPNPACQAWDQSWSDKGRHGQGDQRNPEFITPEQPSIHQDTLIPVILLSQQRKQITTLEQLLCQKKRAGE